MSSWVYSHHCEWESTLQHTATHSCVCDITDSCVCGITHSCVCDVTHSCVCDIFMCVWHIHVCVTWLIRVVDMTQLPAWHDSFIRVTQSCWRHDSCMCVTWLAHARTHELMCEHHFSSAVTQINTRKYTHSTDTETESKTERERERESKWERERDRGGKREKRP